MEAKDLRKGNLITGWSESTEVIKSIVECDTWDGNHYVITDLNKTAINGIKPIPLTEGWLVKFGFDEVDNCFDIRFDEFKRFGLGLNGKRWYYGLGSRLSGYLYYENMIGYIDYVHQLQNLYYALTEKELKLQ